MTALSEYHSHHDKGDCLLLYKKHGGGNPITPYSSFAISRGRQLFPIKRKYLPTGCICFTEPDLLKPYVSFYRATPKI
jgi:hypothetical protein